MKYRIQNILLPDPTVCDEERMYYRRMGLLAQVEGTLRIRKYASCEFSTYFNSFSLNKWRRYTRLSNLHLSLQLDGEFIVSLYSARWFRGSVVRECLQTVKISSDKKAEFTFPVDITSNDSIYFKLTALQDDSVFYGGYYYTEVLKKDLNPVEIDLIMCTYRREFYLKRNLDLIVNQYLRVKRYNGSAHFHILVVDNGQTLDPKEIVRPGLVDLYPNINAGGSGGFCRGMMESLHNEKSTHMILMDDDVLVQVEAFEKTYNFLTLLKEEYNKAFIGGAMIRLDQKNIQHENLATFKGYRLVGLKQQLNLNQYSLVLFNEMPEPIHPVYAAWWYCCMPKTIVNAQNLPYPFFVRMDDIEYSVRNIKEAISLNGICVWHDAFDNKYSTLMEDYFMFRNNLVVDAVHGEGDKYIVSAFFTFRFIRAMFQSDYGGAELLCDGVDNFLKGPEFFKTVDPVQDRAEHGTKQTKAVPVGDYDKFDVFYGEFRAAVDKNRESIIKQWFRYLTLNGHLLPSALMHRSGFAEYGYGSHSKMFFGKRTTLAIDPNFQTVTELKRSSKKDVQLYARGISTCLRLFTEYDRLRKEYKAEFPAMTNEVFWTHYLRLDEKKAAEKDKKRADGKPTGGSPAGE